MRTLPPRGGVVGAAEEHLRDALLLLLLLERFELRLRRLLLLLGRSRARRQSGAREDVAPQATPTL